MSSTSNQTSAGVMRFMLADGRNPGSILASLAQARENSRTSREILPNETWEQINDLYLYAKEHASQGVGRRGRFTFLRHVVGASQQLTGLWADTMSHGPAYNFARIGRTLERADMTTRIMDAGFSNPLATLAERLGYDEPLSPYQNALWMSVLYALSAYQAYRQAVPDRFNVHDAVAFLLKEKAFPRSAAYCVSELSACLKQLPRNQVPVAGATRLQRRIAQANVTRLLDGKLHKFIDSLQSDFINIDTDIAVTWFNLDAEK